MPSAWRNGAKPSGKRIDASANASGKRTKNAATVSDVRINAERSNATVTGADKGLGLARQS